MQISLKPAKKVLYPEQASEIDAVLASAGITREQAAGRLHIRPETMRKYQKGYNKAGATMMTLIRSLVSNDRPDHPVSTAFIVPTRKIPMVTWAQAGQMMDYEELPTSWQKTVPTDLPDPDAFAVQLVGDSMEPRYHAGDVAYVTPSAPLTPGMAVIARLANQGVVFKLYSRTGNTIRFSSYNPAHPPFEVPVKEVLKIYPVAAVMKIILNR